jgi:O-antigen ligase
LPFFFLAGVYIRAVSARQIALAVGLAITIVGAIAAIPFLVALVKLLFFSQDTFSSVWGDLGQRFTLYDESSTTERLKSLQGGLSLFINYPIFGAGLGAYTESVLRETGAPLVIHSTPLWLLAETGLVGFFVFSMPIVRIFWSELRRSHPDVASKLLVLIIVAFAVMSSVHEMLYQRSFWLLLGAAMASLPALAIDASLPRPSSVRSETSKDAIAMPQAVG